MLKWRKRLISSEFSLFWLSLFIAFVIWLVAKRQQVETATLSIPVKPVEVPAYGEVQIEPQYALVKFQFHKALRRYISPGNFTLAVNLKDIAPGAGIREFNTIFLPVSVNDVKGERVPVEIKPLEIIEPTTVVVKARLYAVTALVKPQTQGSLLEDYQLVKQPEAQPSEVLITGPPEVLDKLKSEQGKVTLLTSPVNLENKTGSFFEMAKLLLPPQVKLVDEENRLVQVVVAIEEKPAIVTLTEVPITINPLSSELKVQYTPPVGEVTIEAPRSSMPQIAKNFFLFSLKQPLDESPGLKATVELEVRFSDRTPLELREKVRIVDFTPKSITLSFEKKSGET